jgi:hypothetical protein
MEASLLESYQLDLLRNNLLQLYKHVIAAASLFESPSVCEEPFKIKREIFHVKTGADFRTNICKVN